MTATVSAYREKLGRLVLLRSLGALGQDDENRMLDELDDLWNGMTVSEREDGNRFAGALARGTLPIGATRPTAANRSLRLQSPSQPAPRSSSRDATTNAEYTFIPLSRQPFYTPARSEGGNHPHAAA